MANPPDRTPSAIMRGPDGRLYLVRADADTAPAVLDPGDEIDAGSRSVEIAELPDPRPTTQGRAGLMRSLDRILHVFVEAADEGERHDDRR